jgi:hypothetical protein
MCVDYKVHQQALTDWACAMKADQHNNDEKQKQEAG